MRFNEKEMSQFALSLVPDREGLLEKKGAGRGQGEVKISRDVCRQRVSIAPMVLAGRQTLQEL